MPTKLFDLKGRVALITGASRGIGEATARLLAEQGAHVVLSSRKQADLDAVAASIIADGCTRRRSATDSQGSVAACRLDRRETSRAALTSRSGVTPRCGVTSRSGVTSCRGMTSRSV